MTAPNPYRLEGPALISFSGGRTSGFMLRQHLDAHDGQLPDDVHVVFANTGKEREETLRFVHDCATHWGVDIVWVEALPAPPRRKKGDPKLSPAEDSARRFRRVGFNSASRNGEPFSAKIKARSYLPNPLMRYCTTELKIRPMKHFMLAQGYTRWTNIVGLRADEIRRVARAHAGNENSRERWTTATPMAKAGHVKADVMAFWAAQPFDLALMPHEGNCDLCFLKGRGIKAQIIRARPQLAVWWIGEEAGVGGLFDKGESYAELAASIAAQPMLGLEPGDEEHEVECGLFCAGDMINAAGVALNRGCGRKS